MSAAVPRIPTKAEREFLLQLRFGEVVTRGELGCVVMAAEGRARQQCRKRGWARYVGRGTGAIVDGWVLTGLGKEVRKAPTPSSRTRDGGAG